MARTDAELLNDFVKRRDEAAFTEFVKSRIDFVYAAALRQLRGDSHRAEDITQEVFVRLARTHPPAADAMRQRFATAKARLLAGDDTVVTDVAQLANALGDQAALLAVYDALADDAPGKTMLSIYGFDALREARRYTDALRGQTGPRMLAQFDLLTNPPHAQLSAANRETIEKMQRKSAVDRITKQIEVLAGVGDLDNGQGNLLH